MGDPVIAAIDRVYDLVDVVVDRADRVLNRVDRVFRGAPHTAKVSKAAPKARRSRSALVVATATGLATMKKSPSFRLVEAVDASTGVPVFIVTNGVQRAEWGTRELAVKCLAMLEAAV